MSMKKSLFNKIFILTAMFTLIAVLVIAIIQNNSQEGVIMTPGENYHTSVKVS